jgi:hypothetical protein
MLIGPPVALVPYYHKKKGGGNESLFMPVKVYYSLKTISSNGGWMLCASLGDLAFSAIPL